MVGDKRYNQVCILERSFLEVGRKNAFIVEEKKIRKISYDVTTIVKVRDAEE